MPIQTRSAARKAQAPDVITCVEKGVYVRTAQSATGEGMQIRWEHDEAPGTPKTEGEEAEAGTDCTGASALGATYSYSSLFDGSLSSISSSGSSDLSDSSFGSTFPDNSSNGADQSLFDTYYNVSEFTTTSSGQDKTPNLSGSRHGAVPSTPKSRTTGSIGPIRTPHGRAARPLQGTPVKHWRRNVSGKLVPADEDDILNPPPRREPPSFVDPQVIFERELEKMAKQREELMAALGKTDEENQDMDCDAGQAYVPRGVVSASTKTASLGPTGTEIIEDTFNAASVNAEQSVYPNQWIERRSTGLRSFPTEMSL